VGCSSEGLGDPGQSTAMPPALTVTLSASSILPVQTMSLSASSVIVLAPSESVIIALVISMVPLDSNWANRLELDVVISIFAPTARISSITPESFSGLSVVDDRRGSSCHSPPECLRWRSGASCRRLSPCSSPCGALGGKPSSHAQG
jgi:hypothetical protein